MIPPLQRVILKVRLSHSLRVEEHLVDHLFNSSEKRLARMLLLLANSERKVNLNRPFPT